MSDAGSSTSLPSMARFGVTPVLSIYLKSQDYGDVGAEAQQGRLTM